MTPPVAFATLQQQGLSMSNESKKAKIIEAIYARGQVFPADDGYVVFWTDNGFITAEELRIIADELDRANKPWDEQVRSELEKLNSKTGGSNAQSTTIR